jgi:hypothetical protein
MGYLNSKGTSLEDLSNQYRGRKFGELVLYHMNLKSYEEITLAISGLRDTINIVLKDPTEEYIKKLVIEHSTIYLFWEFDCGRSLISYTNKIKSDAIKLGIKVDDDYAFNVFNLVIQILAANASIDPYYKAFIKKSIRQNAFLKVVNCMFQRDNSKDQFRWSVIFMKENLVKYEMQCDNVVRMLGFYMITFSSKGNPISPWRIYLRFNKTIQTVQLLKDYFPNERSINEELFDRIKQIDPGYEVNKFKEVIFINRVTGESIPISSDLMPNSIEERLKHMVEGTYKDPITFFTILDSLYEQGIEQSSPLNYLEGFKEDGYVQNKVQLQEGSEAPDTYNQEELKRAEETQNQGSMNKLTVENDNLGSGRVIAKYRLKKRLVKEGYPEDEAALISEVETFPEEHTSVEKKQVEELRQGGPFKNQAMVNEESNKKEKVQSGTALLALTNSLREDGYTGEEARLLVSTQIDPEGCTPEELKQAKELSKRGPLKMQQMKEEDKPTFMLMRGQALETQGYTPEEADLIAAVTLYPDQSTPEDKTQVEELIKRGPAKKQMEDLTTSLMMYAMNLEKKGYSQEEALLMVDVRAYPKDHTPEEIQKVDQLFKRGPNKK